jgi:hypothetical protein
LFWFGSVYFAWRSITRRSVGGETKEKVSKQVRNEQESKRRSNIDFRQNVSPQITRFDGRRSDFCRSPGVFLKQLTSIHKQLGELPCPKKR